MSQSLSGSEFLHRTYQFAMSDSTQVGEARRFAAILVTKLRLNDDQIGRVGIVINELGNNLVKYATEGKLLLNPRRDSDCAFLEIVSVDSGPGLNPDQVIKDGFTTGQTPGTGLGAVKRLADSFDIYSQRGKGTVIMARITSQEESSNSQKRPVVGSVCIPLAGEDLCGDAWSVRTTENGLSVLVADGLGHGPLASAAAREAIEFFKESPPTMVDVLLQKIHMKLRSTRGAAVFLVKSEKDAIQYTGAGNIRALVQTHNACKSLISQNGTAGLQIRSAKPLQEKWSANGLLVLHSDGIGSRWDLSQYPGIQSYHPTVIATLLHRDFSRGSDDSTVVVIRRSS